MRRTAGGARLATAVAAALVGAAPALAAPPVFDAAPGRVLFSPAQFAGVRPNVDAGGGGAPVVLADGSLLVVTAATIAKLEPHGALDRGFGDGGIRAVSLRVSPHQVLRQPDGRLVIVGPSVAAPLPAFAPAPLLVERLNADMTVDRAFGDDGVATAPVGLGCFCPQIAALAPGGAIVLTGATGTYPSNPLPDTVPDVRWSVTRLTASGAVDRAFGTAGVATVGAERVFGFNVGVLPDGRVVTQGQTAGLTDTRVQLARLTASGAPDPAFAGGKTVDAPFATGMLAVFRPDGSVVLGGSQAGVLRPPAFTAGDRVVAAYTAAGTLDPGFGRGGIVNLGNRVDLTQLLALPGRRLLVTARETSGQVLSAGPQATLLADTWEPSGPVAGRAPGVVRFPFGGGGSSFLVSVRPRPLPKLAQNSFSGQTLLPRADSSFLAVGGVSISQPTGEGTGYSLGRSAVVALTPGLALDRGYGGPQRSLTARIALTRQRAATAPARHGIRVRVSSSAVGLWRVKIRDARGRVLAQSVVPVFRTTPHTLPVELTRTGNRLLRGRRRVNVTVSATARDLFGALATARASGTLS